MLRRREYDREVLLNEKWRLINNITKDLQKLDDSVLYRRIVTFRIRLSEYILQFIYGVLNLLNIYRVLFVYQLFDSLLIDLSFAILITVGSVLSTRQWSNKKIEKKLSIVPEQQKILSRRLALIKERWGGF